MKPDMRFKELEKPTFFIASPGDVSETREALRNMFENLRRQTANDKGIESYAWESETSPSGFDQWQPAAVQIPLPSDPFCKAIVFIFGERIGTPVIDRASVEHIEKLIGEGLLRSSKGKYHLKLNWENGAEDDGAFPLTGTVFELLVTVAANNDVRRRVLPFKVFFMGDESILDAVRADSDSAKILDANWGNKTFSKKGLLRVKTSDYVNWFQEYHSQIKQLRNLIGYLRLCEIQIDEYSIVQNPKEAGEKCKDFLKKHFGYKTGNPFKGLAFYDSKDDQIFYGRDKWLETALEEFEGCWSPRYVPFYGIIGGSGSGKSSLLRAGMIARLEHSDKYNPYKVSIFSANNLIAGKNEETHQPDGFSETPLGQMLEKVFTEILKKTDDENADDNDQSHASVDESSEKTIAQILNDLGKDSFRSVRPQMAVSKLIDELNKCAEQKNISPPEKLRLIIGLDQFEELLDYHNSDKIGDDEKKLKPLFDFFQQACESKRIGFIYTCQTNRKEILTDDEQLGLLIKLSRQCKVSPLTDYEIKDLIRQMFLQVEIFLSEEIIDELVTRINKFASELNLTKPSEESPDESKSTLLPLLSLTLQNIYEHFESRRSELQRKQNERKLENSQSANVVNSQDDAPLVSTSANGDNLLMLELGDINRSILDVENAIKEQIDKGLKATINSPGVNWSDDVLKSLFRRLIRINGEYDDRYNLLTISIPKRGSGKILVEEFLKKRILIPVSSDSEKVRLVHESVIKNWQKAREWIEEEKELLEAYKKKLKGLVDHWQRNKSDEIFQSVNAERLELAGRFLHSWFDVFKPDDGTQPSQEDQTLCDFAFSILEVAMKPDQSIKARDYETSHFLTALNYGRKELVQSYLKKEPTAAKTHRTSKGSGPVYSAIFSEDLEILEIVLKNEGDPTEANNEKRQPIHVAAFKGNIPILIRLVEAGADPSVGGNNDWTALNVAVFNDDIAMVRLLLHSYSVDPNLPTTEGWTPLHTACRYASTEVLKELLDLPDIDVTSPTKGDWLPLHLALYNMSPDVISLLLKDERIDRTTITPTKKSLVELVIDEIKTQSGEINLEILKAVLADPFKKIDPDVVGTEKTETPLYKACLAGNTALIDVLLKGNADVNRKSHTREMTPFLLAADTGNNEVLKLLLPNADFYQSNGDRRTALHLAALNGHVQIIETLFDYIIRREHDLSKIVRIYDKFGFAPIHLATLAGFTKIVKLFLERDKELLDFSDETGRKIFHIACEKGHIEFLSALGADFDPAAIDNQGMNSLHYAARFGRLKVVKQLLAREDIDPNTTDNFGWTALHMSAQNGHLDVVKELLNKETTKSVFAIDPPLSALQAAAAAGQTQMVELLFSECADNKKDSTFFDKTLYLAVKNAQFETASKLLILQNGSNEI